MALKKIAEPYEFLVRWHDGKIVGAHVGMIEYIKDGEEIISHKVLPVQPIDKDTEFPLSELLTNMQKMALVTLESMRSENEKLTRDNSTILHERENAVALVKKLEAELKQEKSKNKVATLQ